MLGNNGGRIGSLNAPRSGYSPSGIYLPNEQSLAKRVSQWPLGPNEAPAIGEAFEGGYFVGYISHTANGAATHALIVAPKATGATGSGYTLTTQKLWKTLDTATANTTSTFDGKANTDAMVAAGIAQHPAAEFCVNLSISGYTDWYLPAQFELDIAYQNLKPTTNTNNTLWGINSYAVPPRAANRTSTVPAQTIAAAFQLGGAQAFVDNNHWTSTQQSNTSAYWVNFSTGLVTFGGKSTNPNQVRAFRRIAL